jgi:hypothetical protein
VQSRQPFAILKILLRHSFSLHLSRVHTCPFDNIATDRC